MENISKSMNPDGIKKNLLIPVKTKKLLLEQWSRLSTNQKIRIGELLSILDEIQSHALVKGAEKNPYYLHELASMIKIALK